LLQSPILPILTPAATTLQNTSHYWGRLDKEWDLAHRKYGRRLMVNFADAPGDLARDGRSWSTVKDYVQWHEVAGAIAGHVIDRYGEAALGFTWSVFNEPDLGPIFWGADWNELQKFYEYTTDAILRAFEDRGYDSKRAFIGGLELGGILTRQERSSQTGNHGTTPPYGRELPPGRTRKGEKDTERGS
jgi:Glycosyl hydrolases family 39